LDGSSCMSFTLGNERAQPEPRDHGFTHLHSHILGNLERAHETPTTSTHRIYFTDSRKYKERTLLVDNRGAKP
jgi:hypothetical protein